MRPFQVGPDETNLVGSLVKLLLSYSGRSFRWIGGYLSCDALQVVGFREEENHNHYSEYDEYLCDGVLIRQKAGEFTK
jgi:hypothetical protein